MTEIDPKINKILEAFRPDDGIYKREAVEAAIAHQAEITPHLIQMLAETQADPEAHFDEMGHTYAFMLLGHFKETQAHQTIVDLFSLPERDIDPLYGDLITEDLRTVLFRTCGGGVDDLKRLFVNKAAYEYCRGAALDALAYTVVAGMTPREEALDFLGSLFTGQEDDNNPDSLIWTFAADTIADLHLPELLPLIEQAFAAGRIDEIFFDMDYFTEALELGQEKTFERVRQEIASHSLDDVHESMSWWAMFRSEEKYFLNRLVSEPAKPKPVKQQKAQKKKKRKLAKASKKKNRSRK